ncbi:cytochrome C [Bradyrhizobium sp.]|uniref:c-type cytochrome n=1 Tax=Bradyrhizobium sp. TaxID=376 RepID=UPI003C3714CD
MKPSSKLLAWPALGRGLLVLGALTSWSGPAAFAQNIDEGKSAQQLFANSCATCHSNPRVLAKGRFRPTLFAFLQDHYTTGVGEAWALASYLASVDAPPARSRSAKQKASKRPPAPSAQSN